MITGSSRRAALSLLGASAAIPRATAAPVGGGVGAERAMPGRSYSAAEYGAQGQGRSCPAQSFLNGRGANIRNLADLRAFMGGRYRFATSLNNEMDWLGVQAAIYACAGSACAGIVDLPPGVFLMDQELVIPPPRDGDLTQRFSVELRGSGMASTQLLWPEDLGAGKYAIRAVDARSEGHYWRVSLRDLHVRGGGEFRWGTPPRQQDGILASQLWYFDRVACSAFRIGVSIVRDHAAFNACQFTSNHYNLYWANGTDSFGDQTVTCCDLAGASFASVAVGWENMIDSSCFVSSHIGFAPYGFYREAAPAGKTVQHPFLSNNSFVDLAFEWIGNGAIYGENPADQVVNNTFVGGNTWALSDGSNTIRSRPRKVVVYAGSVTNNTWINCDPGVLNYPHVSGPVMEAAQTLSGNSFQGMLGLVTTGSPGHSALKSPTLIGNTWTGSGCSGSFWAAQSNVRQGHAVGITNSGYLTVAHWSPGQQLVGVAASDCSAGECVAVVEKGVFTVPKAAIAVGSGEAVAPAVDGSGRLAKRSDSNVPMLGIVAWASGSQAGTADIYLRTVAS